MPRSRDRTSSEGLLPRMEPRPRKDGLTTYRFHPLGGKPINLGTDKQAAIRKVLDLNQRAPDEGTFAVLWRLYQETPEWRALAESTQKGYRECWGRAPGTKAPDDKGSGLARVFHAGVVVATKPTDIAKYLRVFSAGSLIGANRRVALLSNLFNVAVERGDIDRNPCREVRRNPETPRTRLVEQGELVKFVEWALQQGKSAVVLVSMAEFAALTGNRRVEFRQLHWPQVDAELIRLQRAKQRGNKTKRELVAISEALQVVLDRMKAQPGYSPMGAVFRSPRKGNPYTDSGFKAMWNRLMAGALQEKVIEERFTFHDLRAHYTSYFKLRFGQLPELHADPATTAGVYERTREVRRQSL